MAASESDREDLLREATALVERAELSVPSYTEPVVAGFRRDGAASFYFGAERVYQFNTTRELRRAYIDGLLYKAERGQLVALTRERSESEVSLVRRELTSDETSAILTSLASHLDRLRDALQAQACTLIGQVPDDRDVEGRIKDWLVALSSSPQVANRPNVR
jgi:hypothetical protein